MTSRPTPRIIDAHTHLFAPDVVADRSGHLARDAWFGELYASPDITLVSPEDLIASMDQAGVAVSIVCGWPWQDSGICREHNDFLAQVYRDHPGRIAWLAIVNPASPDAPAEVERAVGLGACGVGEVNADAQRFAWDHSAAFGATVEACVALDVPIMLHASEPVGHRYPGKGTATPERLLSFIEAYQDLRIVAAHWGGGLPFYELMPEIAALTRNVTYDTAASTYLYRFDVFPAVERLLGPGRVALGTDYPLLKQKPFLRRVLDAGIPADAIAGVLGDTAARVYRLDDRMTTP